MDSYKSPFTRADIWKLLAQLCPPVDHPWTNVNAQSTTQTKTPKLRAKADHRYDERICSNTKCTHIMSIHICFFLLHFQLGDYIFFSYLVETQRWSSKIIIQLSKDVFLVRECDSSYFMKWMCPFLMCTLLRHYIPTICVFQRLCCNLQFQHDDSEHSWKCHHTTLQATFGIFGNRLSFGSGPHLSQIISKFILHTMEVLLRILISELFLWRQQRMCWNHLALLKPIGLSISREELLELLLKKVSICTASRISVQGKHWHTISSAFYHFA